MRASLPADQNKAPLFDKLIRHVGERTVSFHVPGHKGGRIFVNEAAEDWQDAKEKDRSAEFFQGVMQIDVTELNGMDDLHDPQGVIAQAQRLAADCLGAVETYFLVGGSTAGNLAMLATVCQPGDIVLVQRNAHKSVLHGFMLAGPQAVFIQPRTDVRTGLIGGVQLADVQEALRQYPQAKGLLLTNPNYYGLGVSLQPIADCVHAHGIPLLVDEAHGAHYGFHPKLPMSALACGADAVVQSTHKMLSAMTMGAMLHTQGTRIDRNLLRRRLAMLQSSSPSYPIMASLDLARKQLATQGERLLRAGWLSAETFRQRLAGSPCFRLALVGQAHNSDNTQDPFKAILFDATGSLTGPRLQEELERRGCYTEMADYRHVVFAFSLNSREQDALRAIDALEDISRCFGLAEKAARAKLLSPPSVSAVAVAGAIRGDSGLAVSAPVQFDMRPAGAASRTVPLHEAAGEISAEMVVPYPPGIPVLYPGELVSRETVDYLLRLAESGVRFQGKEESERFSLKVQD